MKTRNRVSIFVLVFIILSAVFAYSSTIHLTNSEAQSLSNGVEGIKATTIAIFENNVEIALLEFVPGFGPAFGAYTSYNTGLATAALAQTNPSSGLSGIELFLFLLLTPIYWMEFTCYSLAVEESIALIVSARNRDFKTSEWKWLVGSVLFVAALLFVSAGVEVGLINFIK